MKFTQSQKIRDCKIGSNTKICEFVNLYECTVGENCLIGTFTEVQKDVIIGNNVRIQSHTFICSGVTVEDHVFIGHGVMFTNDRYPDLTKSDWKMEKTFVKKNASIGSNSTILPGITIGTSSIIGAGSVVTKDVPDFAVVAGNPARIIRKLDSKP